MIMIMKSQVEAHMKEIKSQVDQSNQEIGKSLDFLTEQLKTFEDKFSTLAVERGVLEKRTVLLEERLDNMERFSLKTAVEIRNVPNRQAESKPNLVQVFENLTKTLNVQIPKSELMDMYRLPAKKGSTTSTLVVEFTNTWTKMAMLEAVTKCRKNRSEQLNSKHLGFVGEVVPVYISERLTLKTRRLHFLSRELAKTEKYAHCWVKN
ncbi:PREDICTED: uncharacterized protein LOC106101654, partial [Papilio polytes]|uniref:uncharacterized protein LOC106101654 n=1 Tax=Papilio polytes TaxID=76194 RepID=UPI000675FAAB